ncbi:hypothetical protein J7F03_19135 [Streptomyces sp. ISL-43]|uniref:vitamin K epoxide reductase family protein n=1 Tax=Streptomyces sp. ISL-43 TaxID=2819183 RepID=UPI001BEC67A5|nr:vitamin K epoxide reductase family protein [Streptomyces sp. ISL-43]MBT2449171.1 hypothetical protein [Streptomyces sp. ISL-43]
MTTRTTPRTTTEEHGPGHRSRGVPLLLLIGGLIGTLASGVLTYDRVRTLEDPLFTPGCNVNAVLSCGDVMTTWQGNLLGFPNMLLGIAGFAALSGLGTALVAGAVLPRRLWQRRPPRRRRGGLHLCSAGCRTATRRAARPAGPGAARCPRRPWRGGP